MISPTKDLTLCSHPLCNLDFCLCFLGFPTSTQEFSFNFTESSFGVEPSLLPAWKAVLTSQCENFSSKGPKSNFMWFCILYFMFCCMILISEHLASNWIDYKTSQSPKILFWICNRSSPIFMFLLDSSSSSLRLSHNSKLCGKPPCQNSQAFFF